MTPGTAPWSCFLTCNNLTSIDSKIFNNPNLNPNLGYLFAECPIDNSSNPTLLTDLFSSMNKSTAWDLRATFANCSSLTGSAPDLWNTFINAQGLACFYGCSKLSNYSSIPSPWSDPPEQEQAPEY